MQVIGAKRWVLWPPDALELLRLHPASHPSRRQTRQMLSWLLRQAMPAEMTGREAKDAAAPRSPLSPQPEEETRQLLARATTFEMRAGDVLYVPPFWTHAVLTTGDDGAGPNASPAADFSLSLSLISASWVEIAWLEVRRIRLPFGEPFAAAGVRQASLSVAEADRRATTIGRYVTALLGSHEGAQTFARALYHERHAPLTPRDAEEAARRRARATCTMPRRLPGAAAAPHDDDDDDSPALGADLAVLDDVLKVAAATVHRLLAFQAEQPQQHFAESVRTHLLRDYVDELAAWAVGESESGEQLRCWAQDDR